MRRTRAAAVTAVLLAVACAGCFGSTEKASNVGLDSARLNGTFTANSGPAESWFEYWQSATPANRTQTQSQSWANGASGPTSQSVGSLQQGTRYSFRLCGRDVGGPTLCAQERGFETQSPDLASGSGTGLGATNELVIATVNASSGPSGENPTGTVRFDALVNGSPQRFDGNVVCLNVGSVAAILAATGRLTPGLTEGTVFARIAPDPAPGQGKMNYQFTSPPVTNPTCGAYVFSPLEVTGDFTITDAQPPPPPN